MVERNILNGVNIFNCVDVLSSVDIDYITQVFDEVFTKDTMALSVVWPVDKQ